ncbi:YhgE/Pip domain-containing protein, partial [Actinocorallia lasiicapitis]
MIRALRLARYELKRFRTPLQRAGLVFLASVPLMYGAIYLWSNWDPFGRSSQIPIAVVNEDQAVAVQGQEVAAGDDVVTELRKNPELGWRFVGAARARQGLSDGDYYAIITIPEDFSAKLSSGAGGTPEQATMAITLDDANNFLVGIEAGALKSTLEQKIGAAADTAYFKASGKLLEEMRGGLTKAADGAGELQSGAGRLQDGAVTLGQG